MKTNVRDTGKFSINQSYEADPIEIKIEKMLNQEEPIMASMAYIGNERKDGVEAYTDIRTNRWDIAHEVMSKGAVAHDAGREFRREGITEKNSTGEVILATDNKQE